MTSQFCCWRKEGRADHISKASFQNSKSSSGQFIVKLFVAHPSKVYIWALKPGDIAEARENRSSGLNILKKKKKVVKNFSWISVCWATYVKTKYCLIFAILVTTLLMQLGNSGKRAHKRSNIGTTSLHKLVTTDL